MAGRSSACSRRRPSWTSLPELSAGDCSSSADSSCSSLVLGHMLLYPHHRHHLSSSSSSTIKRFRRLLSRPTPGVGPLLIHHLACNHGFLPSSINQSPSPSSPRHRMLLANNNQHSHSSTQTCPGRLRIRACGGWIGSGWSPLLLRSLIDTRGRDYLSCVYFSLVRALRGGVASGQVTE